MKQVANKDTNEALYVRAINGICTFTKFNNCNIDMIYIKTDLTKSDVLRTNMDSTY